MTTVYIVSPGAKILEDVTHCDHGVLLEDFCQGCKDSALASLERHKDCEHPYGMAEDYGCDQPE